MRTPLPMPEVVYVVKDADGMHKMRVSPNMPDLEGEEDGTILGMYRLESARVVRVTTTIEVLS